jgi:hypothetical protein
LVCGYFGNSFTNQITKQNNFPFLTARGEDAKGNGAVISSASDMQSVKLRSFSLWLSACNRL